MKDISPRWVSVKDKTPNVGEWVLLIYGGEKDYYESAGVFKEKPTAEKMKPYTYWISLPFPPEDA